MMMMFVVLSSLVLAAALGASAFAFNNNNNNDPNRVPLRDVHVQTFRRGQLTAARRVAPVAQLTCVGGSFGCARDSGFASAQCTNVGSDGRDAQWRCEATGLPDGARFGRIEVSCEGYDHPDDPYILHNSCALEYELDAEPQQQQQRPTVVVMPEVHTYEQRLQPVPQKQPIISSGISSDSEAAVILVVIIAVVLIFAFVFIVTATVNNAQPTVVYRNGNERVVHVPVAAAAPAYVAPASTVHVVSSPSPSSFSAAWSAADASHAARRAERAADDAHRAAASAASSSSSAARAAPAPSYYSAPSSSSSSSPSKPSHHVSVGYASTKRR
jgi:hypothetical protein